MNSDTRRGRASIPFGPDSVSKAVDGAAGLCRSRWRISAYSCLLIAMTAALPSCVYFNTYYNAQKYFRQAEKARLEQERQRLDIDVSLSGRKAARRQESTSRTRSRSARGGAYALYEKAAKKASDVLEKHRDSDLVDDAMFLAGRALYWRDDYVYAARSFSDLKTHFPESEFAEEATYWRGLCLEAQGLHAEAREVFRGLVNSAGRETGPKAGFRLGEMAFVQEDYTAALEEYHSTLGAFPESDLRGEIWLRIGEANLALEQSSRLDSAQVAFEFALDLAPSDLIEYKARLNSGRVFYARGELDAAQQIYLDLLTESRFRRYEGETRLLLGEYFEYSGALDEALDEYERIRDDFPQTAMSAMAIYRTGVLYLQEFGERERSLEYLQEVQKEKKGSEAARLAHEFLADFKKLNGLYRQIHLADSLDVVDAAATADSMAKAAVADSAAAAAIQATVDSTEAAMAVVMRDSTGFSVSRLGRAIDGPDSLQAGAVDSTVAVVSTGAIADAAVEEQRRQQEVKQQKARSAKGRKDPRGQLLNNLFAVAELFRDRLAIPDSAAHYYAEIERRFPDDGQLPRVLYSIGWIRVEMEDNRDLARPFFERLVAEYPESAHANAARGYLDLPSVSTGEERAAIEFVRIEAVKEADPDSTDVYVPLLDSLAISYPNTETGAKAAFLAAWSLENVTGDTSQAEIRFAAILDDFPNASLAEIVRSRAEARRAGLANKIERRLIALGAGMRPGERIEVIAVEPDSVDSMALSRKYLGFALRAHRRDRLKVAGDMYELSLEERKRNPTALYGQGEMLWEQGYFEDAVESFTAALQLDRKLVGVHHRLFEYYIEASQEDSANKYLREFARMDSRNPEVLDLRTEYPLFAGPEPEDLELDILEELEFSPPETALEPPADIAPLREAPMVRSVVVPVMPQESLVDSATVYVDILIDEEGLPEEVEVFDGDETLVAAAEAAASGYVFYPAVGRSGQEIRVWVELELPISRSVSKDAPVGESVEEAAGNTVLASRRDGEAGEVEPPQPEGDAGEVADSEELTPPVGDGADIEDAE